MVACAHLEACNEKGKFLPMKRGHREALYLKLLGSHELKVLPRAAVTSKFGRVIFKLKFELFKMHIKCEGLLDNFGMSYCKEPKLN